jgi:transketolase
VRNIFAETLYKCAIKNKDIYIIAADISPAGSIEMFRKKYPNRFINVGVAEQVMIGVAAGLAMRKKRPFAYTIATFALYRPFEMIRNDLCYQNLPVTIVGMGGGTIYSNLGGTHLTQEDISVARSIPNMSIIAPCDPNELREAVNYLAFRSKNPTYLRIGKSGEKIFTDKAPEKWKFGKIRKLAEGKEICILSYGPIIKIAFQLREYFKNNKEKIAIYSFHTLKPVDYLRLKKIIMTFSKIVIIEDHSEIGGLASIVKSYAGENKYNGEICSFSLKDNFFHKYGSQDDLLKLHGISFNQIIKNKIFK